MNEKNMGIEVKKQNRESGKWDFPCIVESKMSRTMVMAIAESNGLLHGFVLSTDSDTMDVGYYSNTWDKENFKLFEGKLIMRNK